MSREALTTIVSRAITDTAYRAKLLPRVGSHVPVGDNPGHMHS